jgi:hypothetical protein
MIVSFGHRLMLGGQAARPKWWRPILVNRVSSLSRYLDSGLSLGWWWLFVYGVLTVVVIAVLIVDVFLSLALNLIQQIIEPRYSNQRAKD